MTNVHNFLNSITRTMNTNELHSYFQIKKKYIGKSKPIYPHHLFDLFALQLNGVTIPML